MRLALVLSVCFFTFQLNVIGQISVESNADFETEVCRGSSNMEVLVINPTGNGVLIDSIRISFPEGIEYILGSVTTMFGSTINEVDASVLGQLVLSGGSISSQDSLKFQVSYEAKMPAIEFQDLGNLFKNDINLFYNNGGSQDLSQSNSYNILYPVFSITNVSPTAQTFTSGLSTTRDITIVNAGFGATEQIYITDVRSVSTLQLSGTSIGVISGDTIILSGSDFSGIGNEDNVFDNNESLVITETFTGTACSDITITSAIEVFWGCGGVLKESSTSYANTSIDFQSPNIVLTSTSELASCFENDVPSEHTLTLTNNSSGVANDVTVDIYKTSGNNYDESIFSRFDESSVYYTVGPTGSPIYPTLVTYSTTNSGLYSVLGSSPKGRFEFTIPAISPGTVITVHWNSYSKISGTCQDEKYMGWKADVTYDDVCGGGGYSTSELGQTTNGQLMSIFTETPREIQNGVSEDYTFNVSSFENSLPTDLGVGGQYKCTFTIDAGLQYESLEFSQNNTVWSASSLSVVGGSVIAYFDDPAPFLVPKSELVLRLMGMCGNSGYKTIELNISYVPDPICAPDILIPLVCNETITTRLHCPLTSSCDGLRFLSFEANRTNFGQSDNDLDGSADASSTLDYSKIKRNRLMVGDTMETVYSIVVDTSSINPNFSNFYVEADIELGTNLSFVDGSIEIYDTYSSSSTLCATIQVDSVDSGNDRKYRFSFIPSTHCPSLPNSGGGFVFKHGDSITFTAKYRLSGNIGSMIKEVTINNDMFSSSFLDPWGADAANLNTDKWSCNDYDANVTLIGFFWINQSGNNFTVKSCSKYVAQNFGLSIGDCCSNYGGGNLFPYEYRHWGILKEVKMIKPSNYEVLTSKLQLYNTKKTNATNYQIKTITPDAVNGDTLYYNIEQYYTSALLTESDDGFNGVFKVELAPNCDTPQNVWEDVHWLFNYQESVAINSAETGFMQSGVQDKIRYSPAVIEIVANNPIQDANQRDISWRIELKNANSSSTANTWLHLDVPNNLMITSVETQSGTPLTLSGDLYMVNDIGSNSTENLVIYGRISNCDTVLFTAYSGFDCISFPSSFSTVNCNYDTQPLYVEWKRSNYQTRIRGLQSGDICGQYVNLEIDISSVEIAHMYDMQIKLNVQDTLKMVVLPDSSSFLYPYSSSYSSISTPVFNGIGYDFIINDFVPSFIDDGIPGVFDLNNNRYKLRVTIKLNDNFIPGDDIHIQIEGKNVCAEELKTINLSFDPSSKFTKNEISGLHLDVSNTWSASWGDYDNDGYDDLFIPNYNVNEGNLLYHNDGDGTFTKITTGEIVSTLGSAISGTWADFDNDLDLDLFVCYNANRLGHWKVNNHWKKSSQ
ncbi:FG-GAP-like repeat-containing protein [bacterium]|nr:FG-GAP-like repeat-containing protein [bacterium]